MKEIREFLGYKCIIELFVHNFMDDETFTYNMNILGGFTALIKILMANYSPPKSKGLDENDLLANVFNYYKDLIDNLPFEDQARFL